MRTANVILLLTTDTCCLPGLFEVVPEEMSLCTVEEMVSGGGDGESRLPFTSTRSSKGMRDNFTLEAGSTLTVLSFERHEGEEDKVRCQVQGQQGAPVEVLIPLTALGDFSKGERKECFTLREIMSSPLLRSRRFRSVDIAKSESQLVLTPIYQVHAVMNCENNLLFLKQTKKRLRVHHFKQIIQLSTFLL